MRIDYIHIYIHIYLELTSTAVNLRTVKHTHTYKNWNHSKNVREWSNIQKVCIGIDTCQLLKFLVYFYY